MAQKIDIAAQVSVARGTAFAGLAIVCTMAGLAGDMHISFLTGGYLSLFTCMVLLLRGFTSEGRNYRSTEVWTMLDPQDRPPKAVAQQVIGAALRSAYLDFAMKAAWVSIGLLTAGLFVALQRSWS
jgi:hypothetical protein